MVLPVTGSNGSMDVSLALRFGFEAIFAAIGFNVVGDAEPIGGSAGPASADLDFDRDEVVPDAVTAGLLDVVFVVGVFGGLLTVAGLAAVDFVIFGGLPTGVDFATGVGLTVAG